MKRVLAIDGDVFISITTFTSSSRARPALAQALQRDRHVIDHAEPAAAPAVRVVRPPTDVVAARVVGAAPDVNVLLTQGVPARA